MYDNVCNTNQFVAIGNSHNITGIIKTRYVINQPTRLQLRTRFSEKTSYQTDKTTFKYI